MLREKNVFWQSSAFTSTLEPWRTETVLYGHTSTLGSYVSWLNAMQVDKNNSFLPDKGYTAYQILTCSAAVWRLDFQTACSWGLTRQAISIPPGAWTGMWVFPLPSMVYPDLGHWEKDGNMDKHRCLSVPRVWTAADGQGSLPSQYQSVRNEGGVCFLLGVKNNT